MKTQEKVSESCKKSIEISEFGKGKVVYESQPDERAVSCIRTLLHFTFSF